MISARGLERMRFHSPAGFLRDNEHAAVVAFQESLREGEGDGRLSLHGADARLWVEYLQWDSDYFDCPMYRVEFADWRDAQPSAVESLAKQLNVLRESLAAKHGRYYVFAEVPSEDLVWLQALGLARYRLVETRLTYYHDDLERFQGEPLAATRQALSADIPNLAATAAVARNSYDRYHADPFFAPEVADCYLAKYVGQCVQGFADVVLVPDDDKAPDAFVCGRKTSNPVEGRAIGRLMLAAVSPTRRGCYRALNEALLRWMRTQGMAVVLNTTQSTNHAVIHVSTQLGYRFGRSAHILAACGP